MGFNIYVDEDERRDIEWWIFAETHKMYLDWGERLKDAHLDVSDAFLTSKPFLLSSDSLSSRPLCGEIAKGAFFVEPHQVDFQSECFLVNTLFWEECGGKIPVYDMILLFGEMVLDEQTCYNQLTEWHRNKGLHCFSVYPDKKENCL